ncbi:MAG: FHA domain-containing protein [Sedimentisphaerales bacterium]|nr:FHA domain-containing protein [Sedimentisphaerales bacterium]
MKTAPRRPLLSLIAASEDRQGRAMRLIVKQHGDLIKEFQIDKHTINFGRENGCDVTLNDKLVSRKHTEILYDGITGAWTVHDLDSANKTLLNDKAIAKATIKTGDVIQIGDFTIDVDLEDKAVKTYDKAEETVNLEASLTTPQSETVVRKPDSQHAPAMRLDAKRLTHFSQATQDLCDADSLDALLRTLIDVLLKQFDAFHIWCALREQPVGPMTHHAGKRRDNKQIGLNDLQLQEKIKQSIENKQSLVLPRVSAQMESKDNIRSALIAPVIRKEGCFGLLYADNAMIQEHYSLSDLDYLMFIAMHTAAIINKFIKK